MEFFSNLMSTLGVWNRGVDIVGNLPVEVAEMILQNLDPQSLMNAAKVSSKWLSVCKGSSRLRNSVRRYLREMKRSILQDDVIIIKRAGTSAASRGTSIKTVSFQKVFHQQITRNSFDNVPGFTNKHRVFYHKHIYRTGSTSQKTNLTRGQLRL